MSKWFVASLLVACGPTPQTATIKQQPQTDDWRFLADDAAVSVLQHGSTTLYLVGEEHLNEHNQPPEKFASIRRKTQALVQGTVQGSTVQRTVQGSTTAALGLEGAVYDGALQKFARFPQNVFGLEQTETRLLSELTSAYKSAACLSILVSDAKDLRDILQNRLVARAEEYKLLREEYELWTKVQSEISLSLWQSQVAQAWLKDGIQEAQLRSFEAKNLRQLWLKRMQVPTFAEAVKWSQQDRLLPEGLHDKNIRTILLGVLELYSTLLERAARDGVFEAHTREFILQYRINPLMQDARISIDLRNQSFIENIQHFVRNKKPEVLVVIVGAWHRHGLVYQLENKHAWKVQKYRLDGVFEQLRSEFIELQRELTADQQLEQESTAKRLEMQYLKEQMRMLNAMRTTP